MLEKEEIKKRLTIELPRLKHKEIKMIAAELNMSMKTFVDQAIKDKIDNEKINR